MPKILHPALVTPISDCNDNSWLTHTISYSFISMLWLRHWDRRPCRFHPHVSGGEGSTIRQVFPSPADITVSCCLSVKWFINHNQNFGGGAKWENLFRFLRRSSSPLFVSSFFVLVTLAPLLCEVLNIYYITSGIRKVVRGPLSHIWHCPHITRAEHFLYSISWGE